MSIVARNFTFNGRSLSSFSTDYMLLDVDNNAELNIITKTLQTSVINNDSPVSHYYGAVASSPLTFDIMICRKDWGFLTETNCNELVAWLMGDTTPHVGYFDYCENGMFDDTDFIGSFVSVKYMFSGLARKLAIIFSFQNISAYAFSKEMSYNLVSGSTAVINAPYLSGEIIYPKITIVPSSNGTVIINNTSDPSVDGFSIEVKYGTAIIVNDRNVLTTAGYLYPLSNLNNYNWLAILSGTNIISMSGPATATISLRYYKNIGF